MAGLTPEHLEEIHLCEQCGFDVTPLYSMGYKNPSFKVEELHEIRLALEAEVPVDELLLLNDYKYAIYSSDHMKEIRLGLEHNVDISFYTGYNIVYNPIHNPKRMKQIRLGLEQGLDVTIYNNWDNTCGKSVYSAEQCEQIRLALLYIKNNPNTDVPIIKDILNPFMSPQEMSDTVKRWEILRVRREKLARGELPDLGYYREQGIYTDKEILVINEGLKVNKDFTKLLPIIKTSSKSVTAIFIYCFTNNIDYSAITLKDPYGFFLYNVIQMSNYIKSGDLSELSLSEWGYPNK